MLTILIINLCKILAKNGDYMLIGFKFSNYKSFKDSVEFSMEPLTKMELLVMLLKLLIEKHLGFIAHRQFLELMPLVSLILLKQ